MFRDLSTVSLSRPVATQEPTGENTVRPADGRARVGISWPGQNTCAGDHGDQGRSGRARRSQGTTSALAENYVDYIGYIHPAGQWAAAGHGNVRCMSGMSEKSASHLTGGLTSTLYWLPTGLKCVRCAGIRA